MHRFVSNWFLVLGVAAVGTAGSRADLLVGSLPLAGLNVTENGNNLQSSTTISAQSTPTSGPGMGDYAPIPLATDYGPTTLDLTNLTSFTISNANFGSFATTSGFIVTQTADFLDVYLLGVYTPALDLPANFEATPSSLRISINQSGESLSEAITLNSPPATPAVPEPASLTLLGIGALGLLGYGWKRLSVAK